MRIGDNDSAIKAEARVFIGHYCFRPASEKRLSNPVIPAQAGIQ